MRPIVARDLMTPELLGVSESWTVQEAARYLVDHEISGAVVHGENGEIVGVLSLSDVAAAAADQGAKLSVDRSWPDFYVRNWDEQLDSSELSRMHIADADSSVAEVMTPDVFSVDADAAVPEVARTMLDAHIHRVLVQDDGEFVGVISTSDLLGLLLEN